MSRFDRPARMRAVRALCALLPLLAARQVSAQQCQTADDCGGLGYQCTVSVGDACSLVPCGTPGAGSLPWLSDGGTQPSFGDAGAGDGGTTSCWEWLCKSQEYRYCTVATCSSDSECADYMACNTYSWQECSWAGGDAGVARDGGVVGDAGLDCKTNTRSECARRANLPCRADADCGEGYECLESYWYDCGDAGPVVSTADAGSAKAGDAAVACERVSSGYHYCSLLPLPCQSDLECPSGLSCQTYYDYQPCPRDPESETGDAGVYCPPTLTQRCQPFYPGSGGGHADDAGTPPGEPGSYDAGTSADAGTPTGSAGGTGGGGSVGGAPAGPGGDSSGPGDDDDEHGHGHGHHDRGLGKLLRRLIGSGGCSVAEQGTSHANLVWLSLLGLALASRRRRS